jgi:hypothetical protein
VNPNNQLPPSKPEAAHPNQVPQPFVSHPYHSRRGTVFVGVHCIHPNLRGLLSRFAHGFLISPRAISALVNLLFRYCKGIRFSGTSSPVSLDFAAIGLSDFRGPGPMAIHCSKGTSIRPWGWSRIRITSCVGILIASQPPNKDWGSTPSSTVQGDYPRRVSRFRLSKERCRLEGK